MQYFGLLVFGVAALAATAGVFVLAHRMALSGKGGGILAVLMSPLLWLVLAGPFALFLLIALVRSLRR